jgi:hypothetical protein
MLFRVDPMEFFRDEEEERAESSLRRYYRDYTGRCFERFSDSANPNRFTPSDMLAVSMLSVNVPAAVAIELIDDTDSSIRDALRSIPADACVWDDDADLTPSGPGWKLWDLLRKHEGLGRTITSKLLAAKRPHLFPVYDQYVGAALMDSPKDSDWAAWSDYFHSEQGASARQVCEDLRQEVGLGPEVSVLRIMDVVVWMRVHGDPELAAVDRFWEK